MLVPDVEGSYRLIFRERRFPMHVAIARQHEDCIYILQPKSPGEPAIYRDCIGHCTIVPPMQSYVLIDATPGSEYCTNCTGVGLISKSATLYWMAGHPGRPQSRITPNRRTPSADT